MNDELYNIKTLTESIVENGIAFENLKKEAINYLSTKEAKELLYSINNSSIKIKETIDEILAIISDEEETFNERISVL